MMYGQIGLYIILLLLKRIAPKCMIYKSTSGQFFAVKKENDVRKCVNGVLLQSSSGDSLICLQNSYKFRNNESLSCVVDDVLKDQSEQDYIDENECKCGKENHGNRENRVMFPEEIKPHSYPWVVKIFRYCMFKKTNLN